MADNGDDDISNVFAIPDFWKSSTWLETPTDKDGERTVFALDVNSMTNDNIPSLYLSLREC